MQLYEVVTTHGEATRAISSLSKAGFDVTLPSGKKQRAVAVDMEGSLTKDGKASLLQLAAPGSDTVYIFDIQACPAILDKRAPLGMMLAGAATLKVMHDCRADADALRGQFGVLLQNVWDTQSAEMVLTGSTSRISLNDALQKHLGKKNEHKDSVQHRPGLWEKRPLAKKLLDYAAADVRDCIDLFVAQERRMKPAQKSATKAKSVEQVNARLQSGATAPKKSAADIKRLIDATADAFFRHLTSSTRQRLIAVKTTEKFADELNSWKESETAAGNSWRGGPTFVWKSLIRQGLVKKNKVNLTWTAAALEPIPEEVTKQPKKAAKKVSKKKAQQLAEEVLGDRPRVESNKGGVVVLGPHELYKVTAAPEVVLEREVVVENNGDKERLVSVTIDAKPATAYRAGFQLVNLPKLPCKLPPGKRLQFIVRCTMPMHPGSTPALLSVSLGTFAIGRFLDVTCGNSTVLDLLKPTSEYKPKKGRKRQPTSRMLTPPGSSSKLAPFPVPLDHYRESPSWKESLRLGEGGYLLANSPQLAPLCVGTYNARFSRLLWCEESAQRENLELYSMESVTMRATSARLELMVEGLAEKRPSVLRGDHVDVSCSLGNFRGVVDTVERDRILLKFHQKLHKAHTASTRYDVHFVFRRVPLRLAHQGLGKLNLLRPAVLFPTASQPVEPRDLSYFNGQLNQLQRIAVEHVVAGAGTAAPYLLYGPPGTGKTTTLSEMVAQIVDGSSKKVLVMAPTNAAADVVCERLHDLGGSPCGSSLANDGKMLRLMAFSRSPGDVPAAVLKHTTTHAGLGFDTPTQAQLKKARVVIGTLATAAKLYNLFSPCCRFDCVFIDEAGQALEPECIAPLATLMASNGQVVLAGDHQQLGPVVLSAIARNNGLALSFLERLSKLPLYQRDLSKYKVFNGYSPHVMTMLTDNYRSHPDIIAVPNKLFYHDALNARGDRRLTHSLATWEQLPAPGVPVIFHHLVGNNTREASSPSWFNADEASQVLSYVQRLLRRKDVLPEDIGIIAPYHKQVQKIKKALTTNGIEVGQSGLKVGSTEMFQGQERRVIIISTVRSDPSFLAMDQVHNLGFVANAKRFNVAITRAQALLIVVGNAQVLSSDTNWESLLAHCKEKGAWCGEAVRLPSDPPLPTAPVSVATGVNFGFDDDYVTEEEILITTMMDRYHQFFAVAFD